VLLSQGKFLRDASLNIDTEVDPMEVALMIPCYIDSFYPQVGIATLELLERLKINVTYPAEQTCCGQPMANSGCYHEAKGTEENFVRVFADFEFIVTPSGSCTHHIRNKFTAVSNSPARQRVQSRTYDLVEFLHDILKIHEFPWAAFEQKVALHTSCSAIRGLNMASMSERVHDAKFSKPKKLLEGVPGLQFVDFERFDECCGFGGTFSVTEEAVAAKMGYDKLAFMQKASPDCIVSSDMSCLMHLQGCARRQNQNIPFLHIAEILNGVTL
jgi:L-lactate dehydrogenase complex protein LldE